MTTVIPAYGRVYLKASDAVLDWHQGKDFIETFTQRACNKQDIPTSIVIRYGKRLEKVTSYDPKDAARLDREIARERLSRPFYTDFGAWMKQVDEACNAEVGLSYKDLPDYDFQAAFSDGRDPATVAKAVIADSSGL